MHHAPDNLTAALGWEAKRLMAEGWNLPEVIVRLAEVAEEERQPTTDELFEMEMARDLETDPRARQAYGWPPQQPTEPKTDNPDLPF